MKKNIIIIILAALGIVFGLYGFAQKVKANQEAERAGLAQTEAETQRAIVEEIKALAVAAQIEAERRMELVEGQRLRADSLQQQLDKCK